MTPNVPGPQCEPMTGPTIWRTILASGRFSKMRSRSLSPSSGQSASTIYTAQSGSVNSVMFENRPSRRVQEIPEGPVRESEVEFTGGKSTEITINGRKVEIPAAQRQKEDSGQKLESGLEEEADSKLPSEERQP